MTDIFDDLGGDPFEPSTTPAPKKRGRPAGQTKPKAKVAAKPRWRISDNTLEIITPMLLELAYQIDPSCHHSKSAQMKVAFELLELIENKKA